MRNDTSVTVHSFIKSIAKFSISSWTGMLFGIVSVSIITRVFTPQVAGILNMFNSAVDIFVSFALLGMGSVVARFFYEPPFAWSLKQMLTRCLLIAILFMLLSSMLLFTEFGTRVFLQLFQTSDYLIRFLFIINALSVMVLTHFLAQFYRYNNDAFHFNIQQILMQFFSKIFVLVAAFINPTADVVLTFNSIGIFILMVLYVVIQRRDFFEWKVGGWFSREFQPLYRFGFFSWPNEVVQRFSSFLLPYLITLLLGADDLGIYSSAGFFVAAFGVLQGGFRTYWSAFMYRYYATEIDKICKVHSYIGLCIITLMGICIIFQHVIYLLIGEAFHGSRLFFTLVLIPPMLGLWEQTTCYGMSLVKKNEQIMIISFLCIALNAGGIYFCIHYWGLLGAAIGVCLIAVIRFLLMTWRGQVYYRSIRSKTETLTGLFILLILAAGNVIFNQQYGYTVLLVLLIFSLVGFVYGQSVREIWRLVHR